MVYFIFGIFFITLIMPLVDGMISLYNQYMEYRCTKIAAKTYTIKKEISDDDNEQQVAAIGFQIPSEEEDEGDENDIL